MKEKDKISFNKELKEVPEVRFPDCLKNTNPFIVPDNYFEGLSDTVMKRCGSDKKVTLIVSLKAYLNKHTVAVLYLTGIVVLAISSVFVFKGIIINREPTSSLASNQIRNNQMIPLINDTIQKSDTSSFYSPGQEDQIQFNADISTDDIINYLDNDVEADSFYNDL